jgi:hypothetical protein
MHWVNNFKKKKPCKTTGYSASVFYLTERVGCSTGHPLTHLPQLKNKSNISHCKASVAEYKSNLLKTIGIQPGRRASWKGWSAARLSAQHRALFKAGSSPAAIFEKTLSWVRVSCCSLRFPEFKKNRQKHILAVIKKLTYVTKKPC